MMFLLYEKINFSIHKIYLNIFKGFFGSNLPDYQRSEIMMFIMGKVPVFGTSTHTLDISQLGYAFVVFLYFLNLILDKISSQIHQIFFNH